MKNVTTMSFYEAAARMALIVSGLAMITASALEAAWAFESAEFAIQELCGHMQGSLGALLMSAAGVGAVISGAFGNFRASFSFIVVGIGAFTTSTMMSLYFPDAANTCNQGANGGGGQQQAAAPAGNAGAGFTEE